MIFGGYLPIICLILGILVAFGAAIYQRITTNPVWIIQADGSFKRVK